MERLKDSFLSVNFYICDEVPTKIMNPKFTLFKDCREYAVYVIWFGNGDKMTLKA